MKSSPMTRRAGTPSWSAEWRRTSLPPSARDRSAGPNSPASSAPTRPMPRTRRLPCSRRALPSCRSSRRYPPSASPPPPPQWRAMARDTAFPPPHERPRMNIDADRLRRALRHPEILAALTLAEWDLVIRQARRAGLLARLAIRLADRGLLDAIPAAPRHHLVAERILAEKHRRDVRNEVRYIGEA